jgi:iron complex outermembrane receptor protein
VPIPPGALTIFGNPNMESERLTAYELGYRVQPLDQLQFDVTAFYNDYDDLRTIEPLVAGPISPARVANKLFGETYGIELTATAQVTRQWRIQSSYSYFDAQLHRERGSRDTTTEQIDEGSSPHHQFFIRSLLDLPWNMQFDSTVRYVDSLPAPKIPSSTTIDLRLAWRPRENIELAVVVQNLLDDRHPEFAPTFIGTQTTEVERAVYGTFVWRY